VIERKCYKKIYTYIKNNLSINKLFILNQKSKQNGQPHEQQVSPYIKVTQISLLEKFLSCWESFVYARIQRWSWKCIITIVWIKSGCVQGIRLLIV